MSDFICFETYQQNIEIINSQRQTLREIQHFSIVIIHI